MYGTTNLNKVVEKSARKIRNEDYASAGSNGNINSIVEKLEKARSAKMRYATKEAELAALKELDAIPSAVVTGAPKRKYHKTDLVADYISKKEEIETAILIEKTEYLLSYWEVKKLILLLDDQLHREILDRRYLLGQSWTEIIDQVGYSRPHIFREHKKAIACIEEKLKDEIE